MATCDERCSLCVIYFIFFCTCDLKLAVCLFIGHVFLPVFIAHAPPSPLPRPHLLSMRFWDYKTAYCFQEIQTRVQPGSLESEAGIFCSTFDRTGSRFITGEADKTIKVYREDETATPETHPIDPYVVVVCC